jgi:uncharacterized HAD superfamily protein
MSSQPSPNDPDKANRDQFAEFLRKEYDNIAQAHFKTMEMISEYIKHYLTLVTIPFSVLVVLMNLDVFKNAIASGTLNRLFIIPVAFLFLVISFIGLMFFWYIFNLRMDALLYARTINGIRKYFYDHDKTLDLIDHYRIRVLPQSPFIPGYREFYFFGPLVITFSILNSLYFYVSIAALVFTIGNNTPFESHLVIVSTASFYSFHVFWYLYLAQKRELSYLQSNILGIDIDGVMNLQRMQFAKYVNKNAGKNIDPNNITVIPVRDCPGLNLTQRDEFAVFNDPTYWTTMECAPGASEVIHRLRNSMRLKIHVFTSRRWPYFDRSLNSQQEKDLKRVWKETSNKYATDVYKKRNLWSKIKAPFIELIRFFPYRILRVWSVIRPSQPIERITKAWLEENNIEFDTLMVEMGSEEVADPAAHLHNRFYASRYKQIKYFIEDDLIKAEKLAYICDVVFLIDQPYNQKPVLPGNVIRVKDWDEIHLHMRKLS